MKNLPDKIYLQIGEDINIDSSTDFNCLSEVTWCKDKINDNDIVYIRADQQQLSEETRKDFEEEVCPHHFIGKRIPNTRKYELVCEFCGEPKANFSKSVFRP